jgi:hypothetical protein
MPTNSKVSLVARIVAETFVVTEEEAKQCAEGLVALAEGWGDGSAFPSWEEVVRNHFGRRFAWRSSAEEERFRQGKRVTASAYERYIQARK